MQVASLICLLCCGLCSFSSFWKEVLEKQSFMWNCRSVSQWLWGEMLWLCRGTENIRWKGEGMKEVRRSDCLEQAQCRSPSVSIYWCSTAFKVLAHGWSWIWRDLRHVAANIYCISCPFVNIWDILRLFRTMSGVLWGNKWCTVKKTNIKHTKFASQAN